MLPDTILMWCTFAIIFLGIISYIFERLSLEVTSIFIVAGLLISLHFLPHIVQSNIYISPEEILAGFANPALITIIALLVIGQGLFRTGALEGLTRIILKLGGKMPGAMLIVTLIIAAITSGFMNNTPVVVIFIPIISALSTKLNISPSKTLIPLSFITILGGMTTLIGSSTNLLVADIALHAGVKEIGFFDFVVPGVILAGVGSIYVLFIAPYMLSSRKSMTETVSSAGGKQFIAQIVVTDGHPLEGEKPVTGMFPSLKNMTVRMVQRDEQSFLPPFEKICLKTGDVIIVAATRKALTEALTSKESILSPNPNSDAEQLTDETQEVIITERPEEMMIAEAVIAPGAQVIGRKIEQIGLHNDTGCIIMGVQRRSRMIRVKMSEIRLEAGDVILVLGSREDIKGLRANRDILLLEWSAAELPDIRLASRAWLIFIFTIFSAATSIMPIVVATVLGAALMIPAGCINMRQATRAFDRRIYLLIGTSLAMSAAMQKTGGAEFIANYVVSTFQGSDITIILSAMFLLIAIMTNFLSNSATAVLFAPIAINTANALNTDPMAFLFAVIFAANCSFVTPMAYQTNLLVMGPGHYKFSDFIKAGTPMIVILWITYSLFAAWYYGF